MGAARMGTETDPPGISLKKFEIMEFATVPSVKFHINLYLYPIFVLIIVFPLTLMFLFFFIQNVDCGGAQCATSRLVNQKGPHPKKMALRY